MITSIANDGFHKDEQARNCEKMEREIRSSSSRMQCFGRACQVSGTEEKGASMYLITRTDASNDQRSDQISCNF